MFNADKDAINTLAWDLLTFFEWSETPQGYEYWQSVFMNLHKLSETQDENKELPA
jgi:hypothetical protein